MLALENHGTIERPQRLPKRRALQSQQDLRNGWPTGDQMDLGKRPLQLESERIRRDQLTWKTHRKPHRIDTCTAQTRH